MLISQIVPWVSVSLGHHNSFLILCRSSDLDVLLWQNYVVSMPNSGGFEQIYLCPHLYNLVFAYAITSIHGLETTKEGSPFIFYKVDNFRSSWAAITILKGVLRVVCVCYLQSSPCQSRAPPGPGHLPRGCKWWLSFPFPSYQKTVDHNIIHNDLETLTFLLCSIWNWFRSLGGEPSITCEFT